MKKNRIPPVIRTRDYYMLRIIQGATKAGIHLDKRKQESHDACRDWDIHDHDESSSEAESLLTPDNTSGTLN
jgi:hypothetical protein